MAGLASNPVEGRLDALRLDGDPAATTPGVLDGYPFTFATLIVIPNVQFRRTPPIQFVRKP